MPSIWVRTSVLSKYPFGTIPEWRLHAKYPSACGAGDDMFSRTVYLSTASTLAIGG